MTTTIPLDDLGASAGGDDHRRDHWGRLMVVPPGGGNPIGYTRTTTIAKATDDGGGLMPWKATMAVCGTMMRPGLRAQWEALVSSTGGRPWYADAKSKAQCKRLVEECAEAGGAGDRREQGTALHAITAQLDEGEVPHHLSPQTENDIEVYVNTLIAAGVTILPHFVETTVVNDTHRYGGSFDRLVSVRGFGLPMIADLKTGEDISYSWGAFSVQLAGYANAEALYYQGADPHGSEDDRQPMPDVDRKHGLIIHLPAGGARCNLYVVDLEAGWEGFQLSLAVRRWRSRRDLTQSLDDALSYVSTPAPVVEAVEPIVDAAYADDFVAAWRRWLQGRIDTAGRHSDACRTDLIRSWPVGMPTLGASAVHTIDQLAAIEVVLDGVEARNSVPFGDSRPREREEDADHWAGRLLHLFPNSQIMEEDK